MGTAREAAGGMRAEVTVVCLAEVLTEMEAAVVEDKRAVVRAVVRRVASEELTAGACSRADEEAAVGVVGTAEAASVAAIKAAVAQVVEKKVGVERAAC